MIKNTFLLLIAFLLLSCSAKQTKKANQSNSVTTLILLRHAEKASDGTKDPDLNEAGQERANRLKKMLAEQNVTAIYSTPYKRTQQTVTPLAEQLNLKIQEYDAGDKGFINTIAKARKGKTTVVVGHSNTIPALLNQLLKKEQYSDLSEDEYSNLYTVTINKKGLVKVDNTQF